MFGRARVAEFLLRLLSAQTVQRYQAASRIFDCWLANHAVEFAHLTEEEQDWIVADFVLDLHGEGHISRRWPAMRFPHFRSNGRVDALQRRGR